MYCNTPYKNAQEGGACVYCYVQQQCRETYIVQSILYNSKVYTDEWLNEKQEARGG